MLTQRQTMTIGVLTPQALSVIFSNPFFGAFSEGVALAAEEHGYGLHFISPLHGSLARAMSRATVDGVVAIGLSDGHPEVEQIRRARLPIVLVDSTALPEHGSIEIDDVGGARAAAEHILSLGHRDVLVLGVEPPAADLGGPDPDGVTGRRLRGCPEAVAAWAAGLRPTAVRAMAEALAIGPGRARRGLRLGVPGDDSVVGFDDIELAPHAPRPVATVHQPSRRQGEEAVRLLLSVVERRVL